MRTQETEPKSCAIIRGYEWLRRGFFAQLFSYVEYTEEYTEKYFNCLLLPGGDPLDPPLPAALFILENTINELLFVTINYYIYYVTIQLSVYYLRCQPGVINPESRDCNFFATNRLIKPEISLANCLTPATHDFFLPSVPCLTQYNTTHTNTQKTKHKNCAITQLCIYS